MNNPIVNKHRSIINVIAHCIETDEEGVKNLLKRNGVDTSVVKTKKALRKAFINALGKSKALALDFNRYIELKKEKSKNVNANGYDFGSGLNMEDLKLDTSLGNPFQSENGSALDPSSYQSGITLDGFEGLGNTATNPINNQSGSGFFSGLSLKDLLNTSVSILEIQRDIQLSKDNKEAVENAVQIKQDEINLKPSQSNTPVGLYVAIGLIGLTLVGGLIYVATKKS